MKRPLFFFTIASMLIWGLSPGVQAQRVALKTNVLYWGTTTPNLASELALGPKTTIEFEGSYNPFRFGSQQTNRKIQHWLAMSELRRWVYEKFDGHFFGIHGFFGSYNAGNINLPFDLSHDLRDYRCEGYGLGIGASYGYQWYLSPHWNLEAQFGFGYAYLNYKRYECQHCGEYIDRKHKHYFGPTKIGVSIIYFFKTQK